MLEPSWDPEAAPTRTSTGVPKPFPGAHWRSTTAIPVRPRLGNVTVADCNRALYDGEVSLPAGEAYRWLLGTRDYLFIAKTAWPAPAQTHRGLRWLDVDRVHETRLNPRRSFDEEALDELAASVRAHGILEPLVARVVKGESFELICGARRLRAARRAGLAEVPVLVIEATDEQVVELALVENSQRQDVDPFEEASAIAALRTYGRSAEDIADRLGRSAAWVRRRLLLQEAPEVLVEWHRAGKIPLGGVVALCACAPSLRDQVITDVAPYGRLELGHVRSAIERRSGSLALAPWRLDDGTLPGAPGGCSACPRRSGAQLGFWDDGRDMCLDAACWDTRLAAWQARTRDEITAAGGQVIETEDRWTRKIIAFDDEPDEDLLVELGLITPEQLDELGPDEDEDKDVEPLPLVGELLERLAAAGVPRPPTTAISYTTWGGAPCLVLGVTWDDYWQALERAGAPKYAAAMRTRDESARATTYGADREKERAVKDAAVKVRRERALEAWSAAPVVTRLSVVVARLCRSTKIAEDATDADLWALLGKELVADEWRLDHVEESLGLSTAMARGGEWSDEADEAP